MSDARTEQDTKFTAETYEDLSAGRPDESAESENSSPNPLAEHLDFSLSVPTIEVRMVNAAALEDYEIWFLFSSFLGSALVGFFVAYLQSFRMDIHGRGHSDSVYLVVAVLFLALFGLALLRAIVLRNRITSESKTYRMKATASKPKKDEAKQAEGSSAVLP